MASETARAERATRALTGGGAASDPSRDMPDLVSAGIGLRANSAVFETGADLWEVLATIRRD